MFEGKHKLLTHEATIKNIKRKEKNYTHHFEKDKNMFA